MMNGIANGGSDFSKLDEQFLPPPLILKDTVKAEKIENCLSCMMLNGDKLAKVMKIFIEEIELGLAQKPSSLQMENTYVPELPDGSEEGAFLALDLGGTNFRVLLLELRHGNLIREDVKQYHISEALRLGPGVELFQYLAECVQDFLRTEGMEHEQMSLGFTFSFPMKHNSISSGELITWTKSFKCGGMKGVDVAGLLQTCLDGLGLKVTVQVLLNDTTGTLVAGARMDPRVGIAAIIGTGSNGAYVEQTSNMVGWTGCATTVVMDIEWGAFGDNGCLAFLKTSFDEEVDSISLLAGSFTFEKYMGGKYLGDVMRAVLAKLARTNLFPVEPPPGSILTAHLSLFEEECKIGSTAQTISILEESCNRGGIFTAADARVAQYAARIITNRAAQLASVCIATLINRMNREHITVAMDGSVYKRHPRIRELMDKYVALLAPGHSFSFIQSEDGSGKGSALTAAIAARLACR